MNFTNHLDQDEAKHNAEPHLRSKLLYSQIILQQKCRRNQRILATFEEENPLKEKISTQIIKMNKKNSEVQTFWI